GLRRYGSEHIEKRMRELLIPCVRLSRSHSRPPEGFVGTTTSTRMMRQNYVSLRDLVHAGTITVARPGRSSVPETRSRVLGSHSEPQPIPRLVQEKWSTKKQILKWRAV